MLRIAICDDEIEYADQMHHYLQALQGEFTRPFDIRIFTSGEELKSDLEDGEPYDLVLLDIQIESVDGIGLAEWIKAKYTPVIVVFMTGYEQHVYRSFEASPSGFLRKPFDEEEVSGTLHRVLKSLENIPVYIRRERTGFRKIPHRDIICAYSEGKKVTMVTQAGEESFYDTLDHVADELTQESRYFWRIHKSVIINYIYLKKLSSTIAVVGNENWTQEFGISRKYQASVRQCFLEMMKEGH